MDQGVRRSHLVNMKKSIESFRKFSLEATTRLVPTSLRASLAFRRLCARWRHLKRMPRYPPSPCTALRRCLAWTDSSFARKQFLTLTQPVKGVTLRLSDAFYDQDKPCTAEPGHLLAVSSQYGWAVAASATGGQSTRRPSLLHSSGADFACTQASDCIPCQNCGPRSKLRRRTTPRASSRTSPCRPRRPSTFCILRWEKGLSLRDSGMGQLRCGD